MLDRDQLERLRPLANKHVLLPIGAGSDKKGPISLTGFGLKGWQLHEGFSIEELIAHPHAIGTGVRTDSLLCLDFDGSSSISWAKTQGFPPADMNTMFVHRTNSNGNFKVLFEPTQQQVDALLEALKQFQFRVPTATGEQLEFFFDRGRQVIVQGDHYKSGGSYIWYPELGPENLAAPTDDLWQWVIQLAEKHKEHLPQRSINASFRGDWKRLEHCPICGRSTHHVCQIHSDGEAVRCFRGNSYAPPENLQKGEVLPSGWAYCKDQFVGWGTFSVFVKHRPTPLQRLRMRGRHHG